MRVELKNVRHSEMASEETECFSATVYIDGKKAGTVENDGRGGADLHHPHSLRDRLEEIAATLPDIDVSHFYNDGETHTMKCSAEIMIDDILQDVLRAKRERRLCARQTLFRKPGQAYEKDAWHVLKAKFSPEVKKVLVFRHGEGVHILNEQIDLTKERAQ